MSESVGVRVLIAEDDDRVVYVLQRTFQLVRAHVTIKRDGQEAKDALDAERFDVLLTDLRMPRVDGYELVRWTRTHHPDVRVVVLSGFADDADRAEFVRLGVEFVPKPFVPPDILAAAGIQLPSAPDRG